MVLENHAQVVAVVGIFHHGHHQARGEGGLPARKEHPQAAHGVHHTVRMRHTGGQTAPQDVLDAHMVYDVGLLLLVQPVQEAEGLPFLLQVHAGGVDGQVGHAEAKGLHLFAPAGVLAHDMHVEPRLGGCQGDGLAV